MRLSDNLQQIIIEQTKRNRIIPVDIKIANGNILLRSFRIYDFDAENNLLKGLTLQEEYSYAREGRDPIYCFLKIDDIKELICADLDLEFSAELSFAKV